MIVVQEKHLEKYTLHVVYSTGAEAFTFCLHIPILFTCVMFFTVFKKSSINLKITINLLERN